MNRSISIPKINIFVIHNNEKRVDKLIVQLKQLNFGEIQESSRNHNIKISRRLLLYRMVIKIKVELSFASYLNQRSRPLKAIYNTFLSDFLHIISVKNFLVYRKRTLIEHQISCKHVSSLKKFLKTKNEFLLVIESDSVLINSSSFRKDLITATELMKNSTPAFTLLSEGYSQDKIGIDELDLKKVNFVQHKIASTNMLSAYLINKAAVLQILNKTKSYGQKIAYLPFDWHVNRVLCDLVKDGISFHGFSLQSGDLIHGSFKGHYKSWR
jgi:hypothetical protein